jgi:hypothetical protein
MPRNSTKPEIILALSISASARALSCRPERVRNALIMGDLVARQVGNKKLISVFERPGGLQAWFESWPIAVTKPKQG